MHVSSFISVDIGSRSIVLRFPTASRKMQITVSLEIYNIVPSCTYDDTLSKSLMFRLCNYFFTLTLLSLAEKSIFLFNKIDSERFVQS